MLDASIRRFKIQQIYLKASAALRWVNSRTAILGTSRPQSIHTPALQQINSTMRAVSPTFFIDFLRNYLLVQEAQEALDPNHSAGSLVKMRSTDMVLLAGTCIGDTSSG